jgi:hypothetical protein
MDAPAPRLHVIPARDAPVAVVLRRGPSEWWHVLLWRLDEPAVEGGAWFHGRIYPRRCDVSPDGSLLGYFAMSGRPPPWDAYYAVSRPPWLQALAAWRIGSAWSSGCEFLADGTFAMDIPPETPPDHGSYPGRRGARSPRHLDGRAGFSERDVSLELRRGWRLVRGETGGASLTLERAAPPPAAGVLRLTHEGHSFAVPAIEGAMLRYSLDGVPLTGAAWADWDSRGRLLLATVSGTLEIHDRAPAGTRAAAWSHDLGGLRPDPAPAPDWAGRW